MSTIKVDTIATRTGSGNITVSNALSGTDIISTTNISDNAVTNAKIANSTLDLTAKVTGALPVANGGLLLATLIHIIVLLIFINHWWYYFC